MKTPTGGRNMVKMIKRSCEIMLAFVLVELWTSVMRRWMDLDVDDKIEWMDLCVNDDRGRIDSNGDDERGWMNVIWTRGVEGQQTFTCVMVNTEMAFSRISACSTLHLN